jgi:hypothetical protein
VPGIFISYRKEDTRAWAISLRDHLGRVFGERQIFFDVDSIAPGRWREQIDRSLDACQVLLVLIGPRWTAASAPGGHARVFLDDDVHRLEIAMALRRPGVTVIPVLVDGARIPLINEMPDDLHGLLECQVSEIGDARDRRVADLRQLTRRIDDLTGQRRLRMRAFAALGLTMTVGIANAVVRAEGSFIGAAFLVAAVCLVGFSWRVYSGMARNHMMGTWVALLAMILSAAMLGGSIFRLAAHVSAPGGNSPN